MDTRVWNLVRVGGIVCLALGAFATQSSAGAICDLRYSSSCGAEYIGSGGGNALFLTDEQHPTGTGFIDSFARVQQNGWEQGYNTSARPLQTDVQMKVDPNFTRDLTLGEVATKVINGVTYREFFLDVNEPAATSGNKNWITLDQLEIFTSGTGSLNDYSASSANSSSGSLAGATKIYDMDAAGDGYVQLDYLVKGNGSGSSDMVFYLADSLFTNKDPNSYVYLFSQFGDLNLKKTNDKYESQAGFEEWFTKSSVPPPNTAVPEPASLLLLGSGLAFAARRRTRRKA